MSPIGKPRVEAATHSRCHYDERIAMVPFQTWRKRTDGIPPLPAGEKKPHSGNRVSTEPGGSRMAEQWFF